MPSTADAADVEAAAAAYSATLREQGSGEFEILMLGVGPDGHVASLFPGSPAARRRTTGSRSGVTDSPKPPPERVSLTFAALNRARSVWFLVSGDAKADGGRPAPSAARTCTRSRRPASRARGDDLVPRPRRRLRPLAGRIANVIELTKGQELLLATEDGQPVTRLQLGLGWDKAPTAGFIGTGAPDIDLDASAVQFAGDQLFDLAFYNNLRTRDGSVVHLGDNLTGRGRVTTRCSPWTSAASTQGRHDRAPGEQLPGPHARVDQQRLLPRWSTTTTSSSPASRSPAACPRPAWRWPSSSATASSGGCGPSARGSR